MRSNSDLSNLFFHELKQYNSTNFRTLQNANLSKYTPEIHKAFSSVITRFFIFHEKHPEITETEIRMLFFKLKLDMVARYFSEFPCAELDELKAFQLELLNYVKENKQCGEVQHVC